MADYRRLLGMRVSGFDAPRPIKSFAQCGFDTPLAGAIARAGYERPTTIQAQALPAALSGRDVLVRPGRVQWRRGSCLASLKPEFSRIAS